MPKRVMSKISREGSELAQSGQEQLYWGEERSGVNFMPCLPFMYGIDRFIHLAKS